MSTLLGPVCSVATVADFLDRHHYLGRAERGFAWSDEFGVLVLANPTARALPVDWLELIRWCLVGTPNGGSQQWSRVARWLKRTRPEVSTVVSYSDPSAGHTGALYKGCNWQWAPTWHRLRPPPSGNGRWPNRGQQSVKDRWVYCLRPDPRRALVLAVRDDGLRRRFPDAEFRERLAGSRTRHAQAPGPVTPGAAAFLANQGG